MGLRAVSVVAIFGSLLLGCPHQGDDAINDCGVATCGGDGDGGPDACTGAGCTPAGCGDGTRSGNEQCDDHNTDPADGCSPTCTIEPTEIEPNDDGTPTEGMGAIDPNGNDFDATAVANANANQATLHLDVARGFLAVIGQFSPNGDEDVYAVTNSGAAAKTVKFDVWLNLPVFGYGASCTVQLDTMMNIRDAAGTVLASNDDRVGGTDRCSSQTFALNAGQTVYVQVLEYGDNAPGQYALTIQ